MGSAYLSDDIISYAGTANGLYDQFYAAIKSWGKYELVSAPGDADLVLEISFESPRGFFPDFRLRILDAKTHIVLWALAENLALGGRKANRVKNWDQALEKLVNDLKVLTLRQPAV